jgi:nucleotide-binding universal stress UspA family protein
MRTSVPDSAPSFKRILLSTDLSAASQAAFQTALGICTALQASLAILHVFETAVPLETERQLLELDRVYQTDQSSLDGLREVAQRAGVTCEAIMVNGIASLSILETIQAKKIDIVVLGTNAPHGYERLVFGSTAETILREAPCPVLTVGPQVSDPAKAGQFAGPVVFATDFDRTTTHAIHYAASFCKTTQSPLHCLNVLPRTLEAGSRSQIIPMIMTEALHHVATESGTTVDSPTCAVTYGSEISNAVVEYAKQHKARLIVLGIRQASIVASHLPAHIAYRIITESPCPVLTAAFASEPQSTLAAAAL